MALWGGVGEPMAEPRVEVHCPICHRLEAWAEGEAGVRVVTPGGARRPAEGPERAVWEVLEASVAAGGPRVVGTCDACGGPLVAEAATSVPRAAYVLGLPGGALTLTEAGELHGPDGPLSAAQGHDRVQAATPPSPWLQRLAPGRSLFQAALLTSVLGPLSVLLLAVLALSIFMRPAAGEWLKVGAAFLEALR